MADGLFTVQAKGQEYAFLLETDRGTTTCRRMERKLVGYYHWWQQDGPQTRFGVNNIRVLIITTSDKRMENLREKALNVRNDRKGSRLFWFSTQDKVNLQEPTTVLDDIWKTGSSENGNRLCLF